MYNRNSADVQEVSGVSEQGWKLFFTENYYLHRQGGDMQEVPGVCEQDCVRQLNA
jgi:hypothetical protein